MRIALGILLLVGGLLWSVPGAYLLGSQLPSGPTVIQTGPNESLILDYTIDDITVFGQSISVATACAISLVPGAALGAIGLYFLFSGERGHTQRRA